MPSLRKSCSSCNEVTDSYSHNYVCKECSFQVCEVCMFSESVNHVHRLSRVDGHLRDYPYYIKESPKKTAKGSKLILGSFSSALPASTAISEQKIKAILSLLHFDTTEPPKDDTPYDALKSIFFPGGNYKSIVKHEGVIYYHINVPDLEDPGQLVNYECTDILPRSVLYIEFALRVGNVLVHCEKGQRRSPTAFLAWLMYHGFSLIESIDMIDSGYDGDENWGESYTRRRSLWIDGILDVWQSKSKLICRSWISDHKKLIQQWKHSLFPKPPSAAASVLTKRKREEITETDENLPVNKLQRVAEV